MNTSDIPIRRRSSFVRFVIRHLPATSGATILCAMVLMALFAHFFATHVPSDIAPAERLQGPSAAHWFGTDMLGRDVYSRAVFGAQISLIVGLAVAVLSASIGIAIGTMSGFNRIVDGVLMRIIDGMMAIPSVLIAIALMAVTNASVTNIIFALTVVEVPRVSRLVRSLVLTLREETFVEASDAIGTRFLPKLWRHIVPNVMAPVLVQATFIAASAMITEAALSFIGAGTPPSIPSWGNIMAGGRGVFQVAPWVVLFPGLLLSLTVLAINLIGDGLRDALDPRLSRQM